LNDVKLYDMIDYGNLNGVMSAQWSGKKRMYKSHAWVDQISLPQRLSSAVHRAVVQAEAFWPSIEINAFNNQLRILRAMQEVRLGEEDFQDSSGYGYHDRGREKLERIFAAAFQAEAALVRTQIVSGTHALTIALFALLRPGDTLLFLTGRPYDTLQTVVGSEEEEGSLRQWGINSSYLPQTENGLPDLNALDPDLQPKVVYIQRSAGYSLDRRTLTIAQMRKLIVQVRAIFPEVWVLVDNCYGEFTEDYEPAKAGADLTVGSLIKNPGGGLAPGGGYAAGSHLLIEKMSARLTAPGLGGNLGAVTAKRNLFQGLFVAPALVENALKNAVFAAALFCEMGYKARPLFNEVRGDIVQAVLLEERGKAIRFCQAIQTASPVESYLTLEPDILPGYRDPVIMAAGTFIQGASGELSADAPMREPYAVFLQGGLTLPHALWATCMAALAVGER